MWWRVFSLLAWFPLQEAFLTNHTETITVEEGQALTLKCVASQAKTASLQWLAPSGFTIFLNEHPALKNSKYQLLHHSPNELSINVTNVTLQDEGVYKCLQYSNSVRTKEVKVIVLATPFKPTLEASVITMQNGEEHVILKCSTMRTKPSPQITWLFGNDIEIYGETHHEFEIDGKKSNSSSTLRVHTYGRNSTVDCLIRHRGLQGRTLVASFRFEDLVAGQETASDVLEESSLSSQDLQRPTSTVAVMEDSSTSETDKKEEEQTTQDPDLTTGANPQYIGLVRKKSGILLLTLVSFLIFILFIVVQLFIMKLRKAHVVWKKENEISEYTLESYKSRSNNEETSSQEKNGQSKRNERITTFSRKGKAVSLAAEQAEALAVQRESLKRAPALRTPPERPLPRDLPQLMDVHSLLGPESHFHPPSLRALTSSFATISVVLAEKVPSGAAPVSVYRVA